MKQMNSGRTASKFGCAFCWEWVPAPKQQLAVFSSDGCLGGRCRCGAHYAIDETGKSGGATLLDVLAMACDGDLDAAMELNTSDYEIKKIPYECNGNTVSRMRGSSYLTPQIWFFKRHKKISDGVENGA